VGVGPAQRRDKSRHRQVEKLVVGVLRDFIGSIGCEHGQ
jgi:hypothetical protein